MKDNNNMKVIIKNNANFTFKIYKISSVFLFTNIILF